MNPLGEAKSGGHEEPNHFYLNIVLLNKDEAVRAQVTAKTGNGIFGKVAAAATNQLVSDESLVNKLSEALTTKVPEGIREMGIRAASRKVFQKKCYVVLRMDIHEVSKMELLRKSKGDEYADKFETLLECLQFIGAGHAEGTIDETISKKVLDGMMNQFGTMIPEKMASAGLAVSCEVKSSADQADFFYEKLQEFI
ncbi:unnamed protein product [Symbiodinium microadriaticum]|nr:unnamed protein product [Symbiodinium microadriaticum]